MGQKNTLTVAYHGTVTIKQAKMQFQIPELAHLIQDLLSLTSNKSILQLIGIFKYLLAKTHMK